MKRILTAFVFAAAALAGEPALAAWPTDKPITIIVPAAPAGTTDIAARMISQKMSAALGTPVIIDNKAGAGGIIGTQALQRAAPDGYTLGMGNIGPNAINYSLYKKLPYKPDDFIPITAVVSNPNVLVVNKATPVNNVQELIAYIKANPTKVAFGSSGTGQSPHMSAEMLIQRAGVKLPHSPYKGAGPAVMALLANQFTFMIDNLPSSIPQIRAGNFKALAVTGEKRSPELPDVPTLAEAGIKNMVVTAWFGLFAPAGTPQPVVDRVQQVVRDILRTPEVQHQIKEMGGLPGGNTPAEFAAFVKSERENWKQTVDAANLAMD